MICDAGETAAPPDINVSYFWFHVSRMREHPIVAPTFTAMQRLHGEDRADLIGITPMRKAVSLWVDWQTQWEAFAQLPLVCRIWMQFYVLFGDPKVGVRTVRPWRQRVRLLNGSDATLLWEGNVAETKKLQAAAAAKLARDAAKDRRIARGRGRGAAAGRGRKGKGRGMLAIEDVGLESGLVPAGAGGDAADLIIAGMDAEPCFEGEGVRLGAEEERLYGNVADPAAACGEVVFDAAAHTLTVGIVADCGDDEEEHEWDVASDVDLEAVVVEAAVVGDDLCGVSIGGHVDAVIEPSSAVGSKDPVAIGTKTPVEVLFPGGVPVVIEVHTEYGVIKYYSKTKNLVAELPIAFFGVRTHLKRNCKRTLLSCKGRPVGCLMAWLMYVERKYGRDYAAQLWLPTLAERIAARRVFCGLEGDAVRYILEHAEQELVNPEGVIVLEPLEVS